METLRVTGELWMLSFPVGQAYLLRLGSGYGYALVDSGPDGAADEILGALIAAGGAPRDLREIVLTHGHKDHTGSAAALAAATGARISAGAADAGAVRGTAVMPPPVLEEWEKALYESTSHAVPEAPRTPVDRELADGDTLDWGLAARVLHVPGHTAGSVAVHLPDRGVLFTGDTVAVWEGRPIPGVFNADRVRLAAAYDRLAALDTDIALFGHGAPLTGDAGAVLRAAGRRP